MTSERLWIAILAAVCFLAGGAGGVLVGLELPRPEPGPFAAFEERLAATFDLRRHERRVLRLALVQYRDEIEELKDRNVADCEAELVALGRECAGRIRQYVLPPERRAEFDTRIAGLWPPGALPPAR
ncbi:MAG: hypothetical protein AB1726_09205 [Planctomycetota bacterium]